MKVSVALLAGGMGVRSGGGRPKAFKTLNGKSLVLYSLEAFNSMEAVSSIRVTIPGQFLGEWDAMVATQSFAKYTGRVRGGIERAHSVLAALNALADEEPDVVLIHDSARPLVSEADILSLLWALDEFDGAILTTDPVDTLWKVSNEGLLEEVVDRNSVRRALTPQAFHFGVVKKACEEGIAAGFIGTDDASYVRRYGGRVKAVKGLSPNPKVTFPGDFRIVEALLKERP